MNDSQIDLFRDLIGRNGRFAITTHMNPDGDAIGSEIAMARFLASRGATFRIVNQEPTPGNLTYLEEGLFRVEDYDPARHDPVFDRTDLILLLDNSAPDRLGRMEDLLRRLASKVFCIDHHATAGTPWSHNILDEKTCATSVMVFDLTRAMGFLPDRDAAEAIYAGLSTDTGFFRFNSTSPRAHEIAADLLRAGVQPARAYQEVFERNSPAYTKLLGQALAGLRLDANGALVSTKITRAMEVACEADGVDTSEMTTPLLAVDGVRIALLFREMHSGRVKVSLRSKGNVDVYRLATEFGGGGHRNASGIVTAGTVDEVAEKVIARAKAVLGESGR
jgi:phosphoesterase RecJ-like protein